MNLDPDADFPRQLIVFGSGGQIGSSLLRCIRKAKEPMYSSIIEAPYSFAELTPILSRLNSTKIPTDYVFACGLTDSRLPTHVLFDANLNFPKFVVQSTLDAAVSNRYLTLGTIHENLPNLCQSNAYLASKLELGNWMLQHPLSSFCHVRLHTIYGGPLKAHMFLGQMSQSILADRVFKMSDGRQLREYSHVDDVVSSLSQILMTNWKTWSGLVELTSGENFKLVELATATFKAFDKEYLLQIGGAPLSPNENFDFVFKKSPSWLFSPQPGAIKHIIQFLKNKNSRVFLDNPRYLPPPRLSP